MKNFLFLDDDRRRHKHFDKICQNLNVKVWHVWTAIQAIRAIEKDRFDCVFLDHDLEDTDRDNTGLVVANFIALHVLFDKRMSIIIHSWNPEGALQMEKTLLDEGFVNVKRIPFSFTAN